MFGMWIGILSLQFREPILLKYFLIYYYIQNASLNALLVKSVLIIAFNVGILKHLHHLANVLHYKISNQMLVLVNVRQDNINQGPNVYLVI